MNKLKTTLGLAAAAALALGGAAIASPAFADEYDAPTYTVVLWQATGDTQFPQTLRAYTSTTDLDLSDGSADLDSLKVNLEECTIFQGDVYEDGPTLDTLIAGGTLTGPSTPNAEPWPGGAYQPQFSVVWTTEGCNPEAIVVVPEVPTTNDECGTENDGYNPIANTPGIVYSFDGSDLIATLESDAYAWGDLGVTGWAVDEGRLVFPFAFTAWTDEPCATPEPTEPPVAEPPTTDLPEVPVLAETGLNGPGEVEPWMFAALGLAALGATLATLAAVLDHRRRAREQ